MKMFARACCSNAVILYSSAYILNIAMILNLQNRKKESSYTLEQLLEQCIVMIQLQFTPVRENALTIVLPDCNR